MMFERPWLDYLWNSRTGEMRPAKAMHYYGGDISGQVGYGAIALNTDVSNSEKEDLLVDYIRLLD